MSIIDDKREMTMKFTLIVATIASLIGLVIITAFGQDTLLLAFASNDATIQAIRFGLIAILAGLLFSKRPRSIEFRTALALISVALTFGVLAMLEKYTIAILDAVMFVEVAIICAIESIEMSTEPNKVAKKAQNLTYPADNKVKI